MFIKPMNIVGKGGKVTGAFDIIKTFQGKKEVKGVDEDIIIQARKRPKKDSGNAIFCAPQVNEKPINDTMLSIEKLEKLPFWLFGAYQVLFFGKNYYYEEKVMLYLNELFSSILQNEFAGKTIDNIMEFLKTKDVPYQDEYYNNPWTATHTAGGEAKSFLDLVILEYQKGPNKKTFKTNAFTKRNVPYNFLWKENSNETNNIMSKLKKSISIYYNYFANIIHIFLALQEKSTVNFKYVQAFADVDSKTILNPSVDRRIPDDESSKLIYTDNPTYQSCHPTKDNVNIAIYNIYKDSTKKIDFSEFIDQTNHLMNCIKYEYDPEKKIKKLSSTTELLPNIKKLKKVNKLQILATLLKEVEIPSEPADEKKAFEDIMVEIQSYDRSDIFMLMSVLLNGKY